MLSNDFHKLFSSIFNANEYMYVFFYRYKLLILVSLFGSRLRVLLTLIYMVAELIRFRYVITWVLLDRILGYNLTTTYRRLN